MTLTELAQQYRIGATLLQERIDLLAHLTEGSAQLMEARIFLLKQERTALLATAKHLEAYNSNIRAN